MADHETIGLHEEIQRLRDEQQRLRDEQEKLRREAASRDGHSNDGQGESKDGKGGAEQKGQDNKEQSKEDGKKGEGEQKEGDKKDEQPKPPLKQRIVEYTRTHPKNILLGTLALIVLIIGIILLMIYLGSYESTDDAEVDGHLNAIAARIGGTVVGVYVEDNQVVAAGQSLVDLDPRDYQVALEQSQASYAQSEAGLAAENPNVPITRTSNETSVATGGSDVASAQAGLVATEQEYQARLAAVRQAEANNVKAQTDVVRYKYLVDKEEVSREQYDSIVAAAKTQAAAVESAQASASAAAKQIDQSRAMLQQAITKLQQTNQNGPRDVAIRQAQVAMKAASVKASKAQLDQAQLNLSYTKITAPVAGIIGEKSAEVGQRVSAGEQMMIITQTDDIWITANFKETQLKKMYAGQSVDIKVDAFGTKYQGYVESMPGSTGSKTSLLPPENATGNYVKVVQRLPVRIRLKQGQDPDHKLRPGMSVEPKVWLHSGPH